MKHLSNLKSVTAALALFIAVSLSSSVNGQILTGPDVLAAAGNLVNVQVGDVNVNAVDVVDVDVANVLNNLEIVALNDVLRSVQVDNVLNGLLRSAHLISGNQIIVGVIVNALGEVSSLLVAEKRDLKLNQL